MKVNGSAFRKAREEIRKNSDIDVGRLKGEAGVGTQEWLADKAKIKSKTGVLTSLSVRTIQYLEKGNASIQVVDAVSPYLGINGRELIFDYGKDSVTLSAPSALDFRPTTYPRENLETFQKSSFLLSLDPLLISFESDDLGHAVLEKMKISLRLGKVEILFQWLYEVSLTPNGTGWLGIESEVYPLEMTSPHTYRASIMFNQIAPSKVLWEDFIKLVEETEDSLIKIELLVDFGSFSKTLKIGVSVSQVRTIMSLNKQNNGGEFPFYIQPDALTW